jgi:hypothetical protein
MTKASRKKKYAKNYVKKSAKRPARKSSAAAMPLGSPRGIVKVHPEALVNLISAKPPGGKIAPGFTPQRSLNMKFLGGRTLPKLSFRSFYLGSENWDDSDIQNIDRALSEAMSDPDLNNVLQQYFPNSPPISTSFLGSTKVPGAVDAPYTRDSVSHTIEALMPQLDGTDFDNTVICLFLPPGVELTDDAADGVGKSKLKGDDDEDSSQEGLGGYHGSHHSGDTRVYFAVGVFSEVVDGVKNGIPVFPDPWKNVVATFYHELVEARTDPDVEESNRTGNRKLLGWYANVQGGGEIGDIPMNEAVQLGNIRMVMLEVPLVNGNTAPIQLMWSNAVGGPQGPFA